MEIEPLFRRALDRRGATDIAVKSSGDAAKFFFVRSIQLHQAMTNRYRRKSEKGGNDTLFEGQRNSATFAAIR